MMELKYSLLVVLLLLGNKIERSSAEEDDDDHHHDEEKCGVTVDPFMEIKEAINVTQDELGSTALEHLVEHVLERFDCEEATCQCITSGFVLMTGQLTAPVVEADISTFSIAFLRKLQNITATCQGESAADWSSWWSDEILKDGHPHELEEFLDKLKAQLKHEDDHDENGEEHNDEDGHEHSDEDGHEHSDEEGDEHDDEDGDEHSDEDGHEHGHKEMKCFDAKDLMAQAGVSHDGTPTAHQKEMVANLIVTYLLQGYEINDCPADTADFLDGIWNSLNLHGDEKLSEEKFQKLLSKLKIGKASSSGDDGHGHGHAEDSHDHRRKREIRTRQKRETEEEDEKSPVSQCFSGEQLLTLFNIDHETGVSQTDLVNLCPALIQQQISGACGPEMHKEADDDDDQTKKIGIGFVCILVISLGSLLGVFIVPCLSDKTRLYVMCGFIGLAVGTLAADALLHLIPEAFGLHSHGDDAHDHEEEGGIHVEPYFWKALLIVGGIYLFFLTETILSYFGGSHHHHHHAHEHHEMNPGMKYSNGHAKSEEDGTPAGMCDIKPMAWMIIIGDAVHNLADGLAVGAAFSLSISSGFATSIAVFCHEVPHEIGDFAVLLRSGMSNLKAAFWNFFSALTAVVGFFIAVSVSTDEEARRWIFTLAAGMFLYVALTDMIPELVGMKDEARKNGRVWLFCFFIQNLGILTGILIMVLIGLFEEEIHSVEV